MAIDLKQSTADPVAVDIGNKEIQGRVVSKTIQTAMFTTNENAVWAGSNNLRKESYPFAVVSFPANRNAFRLEVGDCFKFSYARYGISNMICRVLQISEEGPESETITVQAMEDIFSVNNAITAYASPTGHAVPATDYTVSPFTHQKIIEAPYVISTDIKLLPIACRESEPDLGYDVYMSIDGGASYSFLKRIPSLQPYGTLVGSYSGDTYTIDDDVGLTIDIEHGASLIETTTFDQVLAGLKNTALLGDEFISFQTITPVSGTQYKLEHVIRGRYDTVKESHAEGAEFYCLPSGALQLISSPELITGAVRKFKFVPYNIKKSGAIAEATALDLTIAGRALTPYLPGNLCANGVSAAARYDTDIVLTWSPRYRGKGAGIGLPGTVLPETDREGLFKVEIYVEAPFSLGSDFAPHNMTSNDAPSPYSVGTYPHSAAYNVTPPWKAFDGTNAPWVYDMSGWEGGEAIWLQWGFNKRIYGFSIKASQDHPERAPAEFILIGLPNGNALADYTIDEHGPPGLTWAAGEEKTFYRMYNLDRMDMEFTGISLTVCPVVGGDGICEIDEIKIFETSMADPVRTATALDAATWTYTEAMNIADNGSAAAAVTFRVSDYRTEGGITYESDRAEVTCKLN